MRALFTELLSFQVRPDRTEEFEALFGELRAEMAAQPGCLGVRACKRFYTFDGVERSAPPRELTRAVKCVRYFAWWEFGSVEDCGMAAGWLFDRYEKKLSRLLIQPFSIDSGYSL